MKDGMPRCTFLRTAPIAALTFTTMTNRIESSEPISARADRVGHTRGEIGQPVCKLHAGDSRSGYHADARPIAPRPRPQEQACQIFPFLLALADTNESFSHLHRAVRQQPAPGGIRLGVAVEDHVPVRLSCRLKLIVRDQGQRTLELIEVPVLFQNRL